MSLNSGPTMTTKISLLLPSRGRPSLVRRLFESIVANSEEIENIEIILCLDDDDTQSHLIDDERLNIVKTIGPPATMGSLNSRCFDASTGDIIMLMNDDLVVCTPGWDNIIRGVTRRIPDQIFMAYPDDMEKANLSTFPIMSRKTCEILVNPYPKEYDSLFIDDHIFDIFTRLKYLGKDRIHYLENIKFDHRHFVNGKVRPDANYIHKNRYKDYLTFISLRHVRQASARRLHAAIEGRTLPIQPWQIQTLEPPPDIIKAVLNYSWLFLTDHGLPLGRRIRWFIRFTKYYAAMKGGMNFLRAKTYTLYGN
jgi:hypothetical protein